MSCMACPHHSPLVQFTGGYERRRHHDFGMISYGNSQHIFMSNKVLCVVVKESELDVILYNLAREK
jgi:hypothetical protein